MAKEITNGKNGQKEEPAPQITVSGQEGLGLLTSGKRNAPIRASRRNLSRKGERKNVQEEKGNKNPNIMEY